MQKHEVAGLVVVAGLLLTWLTLSLVDMARQPGGIACNGVRGDWGTETIDVIKADMVKDRPECFTQDELDEADAIEQKEQEREERLERLRQDPDYRRYEDWATENEGGYIPPGAGDEHCSNYRVGC